MKRGSFPASFAILLTAQLMAAAVPAANVIEVTDIFGRVVNERGLTLVDWEGYMANPAIKFFIKPPASATFPLSVTLTANSARLYFDLPSTTGANGPVKNVSLSSPSSRIPIFISIFPDRDTMDEDYTLSLRAGGQETQVPIHVVDQDTTAANLFDVTVTFSQDKTGFFDDPAKRAIVEQAAADWAYFIGDMNLDLVPAGTEQTFIWDKNGFVGGNFVPNAADYKGFLLYAYGIHSGEVRSGGEPSSYGFQHSVGTPLPIRRSGGYEAETAGNYNSLGWFLTTSDNDWWVSGNLGNEPNDLYSIAHHEIGHSLFFNPAHTRFGEFKTAGRVDDPAVIAYHGTAPHIDNFDHFNGETDNASLRGAFGYEYYGSMPKRRWLITKLDLLNAQAIGYTLRKTSAFVPLALSDNPLPTGTLSTPYSATLRATGGIPFYNFEIATGSLPPGLKLDPFSGRVSGTPNTAGDFPFTVRAREYDLSKPAASGSFMLKISTATKFQFTPPLKLLPDGSFQGRLAGGAGQSQVIEATGNFHQWVPVATNLQGNDTFDFIDSTAVTARFRFYRARVDL
jgi:hypothetical protein